MIDETRQVLIEEIPSDKPTHNMSRQQWVDVQKFKDTSKTLIKNVDPQKIVLSHRVAQSSTY